MEEKIEFRFVLDNNFVEKFSVDKSKAQVWVDYYFTRELRIRHMIDHYEKDKIGWSYIETEPGTVVKNNVKLEAKKANDIIEALTLKYRIEKSGFGLYSVTDIEGYIERVSVYDKDNNFVFSEVQIEFEDYERNIQRIKRYLEYISFFREGTFDYIKRRETS